LPGKVSSVPDNGMAVSKETLRSIHHLLSQPERADLEAFLEERLKLLARNIDSSPNDRATNQLIGERKGVRFLINLKSYIERMAKDVKMSLEEAD